MLAPKKQVDTVLVQVVRNGLDSIAEQMSVTIRRTAYSTIIREVLDYATALFDCQGRLIAQSSRIPIFVNAMGPTLRFVLANTVPLEEWEEGDVFLVNDPYLGGSQHLPDLVTFTPIFHDGKIIGVAGAIGHHVDIGGSAPGGYNLRATEIFQEGLRIPPVRLYQRGKLVTDMKKLITANMRIPELTWGDVEAQLAAMHVGVRGMIELVEQYGANIINDCVEELLDYSDRIMRHGISQIPDGSYEFEDFLDNDGISDDPIRIRVKMVIEGDHLTADFTGTDGQRPVPINGSKTMVTAAVHYAVMAAVAPDAPLNEGCFRPINIVAPEGSVVNCNPPAPVVGRIAICHRTCDAVLGALAKALPGKIPAAYYGMSNIYCLSGRWENGAPWILFEVGVGGWGGRPQADGIEACSAHVHNVANTPVEMLERLYPVRVRQYALRADSGGAGEYRGGCGYVREIELTKGEAALSIHSDRMRFAPYGVQGGGSGMKAEWLLNPGKASQRALSGKEAGVKLSANDVLSIRTQGGGGYGDPRRRPLNAIARDIMEGKVTQEAANKLYDYESRVSARGEFR